MELSIENTTETIEENVFGPRLPPHLLEKKQVESSSKVNDRIYGPILPDDFRINKDEKREEDYEDEELPSTSETCDAQMIGPEIPQHLKSQLQNQNEENSKSNFEDTEKNESEMCYGPCPTLMVSDQFSYGYKTLGRNNTNKDSEDLKEKRESWMLIPPENKTINLAVGGRKFRKNIPSEKERDQSGWTETPQNKKEKKKKKKEKDNEEYLRLKMLEERNKEMEALIESSLKKKHRKTESLMEMHIKKMKKKKKKRSCKK